MFMFVCGCVLLYATLDRQRQELLIQTCTDTRRAHKTYSRVCMWKPLTSGITPCIVWINVSFQPNRALWLTASSKLSSTAESVQTRQLRTRVLVGDVYYASSMFALTRRWGIPQHNLIKVYSRHTHTHTHKWSCTTVTQVQYRVFEAHRR